MTFVAVFLVLVLAAEATYLWLGRLEAIRAEQAYWAARRGSPDLYDWADEGDL